MLPAGQSDQSRIIRRRSAVLVHAHQEECDAQQVSHPGIEFQYRDERDDYSKEAEWEEARRFEQIHQLFFRRRCVPMVPCDRIIRLHPRRGDPAQRWT